MFVGITGMYVLAARRSNDRTFLYGYPTCVVSNLQITGITKVAVGFPRRKVKFLKRIV